MDAPILLASASPRRRRLIEWIGSRADICAVDVDEDLSSPLRSLPPILARSIAADKARAARDAHAGQGVILAFDTIVLLDRRVLGKPADLDEAREMLAALSGREHEVITGVAVLPPGQADPVTFAVTTKVSMADLDDAQLESWLSGDEVLGCAGAYNIERHLASVGPDECYQNVAGLPLCHVYQALSRHGLEGLSSPVAACEESRGVACELGVRVAGRR
jgi:septum formation protein